MDSWGALQPLSPEFYTLLRFGLFLVLFFHLPYVGSLIGGTTVSLLLTVLGNEKRDPAYLRCSRELVETAWTGKTALLLFGLAPLLFVWVLYARILFTASPLPWAFWSAILALLLLGFALLGTYRSAAGGSTGLPASRIGAGVSGLLAVLLAFFLFSGGYGILFNPEKLPLLQKQVWFLLSWNGIVKFLLFLTLFFGMMGVLLLLLGDREPEETGESDSAYRGFVRDFGAALTVPATLVLPVFLLLNLVTLPPAALSVGVFAASAAVLVLSLAVCLTLSRAGRKGGGGAGTPVSVLYVLLFLALLAQDHAAVGNAYRDRIAFLGLQAPAAEAGHAKEEPRKETAAPARGAEDAGKAVFERVCAGCHRFDVRVVGPPLNERVPEYRGDVEKLKAFIRKPVKVNPGYPSMPSLGLPEEEIDAVARYLIRTVRDDDSK